MAQHEMRVESLESMELGALAELFTAGYQGYFVPMHVDAPTLAFMIECFDIQRSASRVLFEADQAVAFALLGMRGSRGWIGGLGVPPAHRRRGLGDLAMKSVIEVARQYGLERIGLEVLVQNEPAIALYRRLGFETVRRVEVWSAAAEPLLPTSTGETVRPVDWTVASDWIASQRRHPEPWQRETETLARLAALPPGLRGWMLGPEASPEAACVSREALARASILQFAVASAASETAAAAVFATVVAGCTSLRWLNVPEDEPALALIRSAGGTLEAAQWEMQLSLR